MNWEECGRKQSRRTTRYSAGMYVTSGTGEDIKEVSWKFFAL
jgi:hypothetical protein